LVVGCWLLVVKDVVFIGFVKDFFVFSGPPEKYSVVISKSSQNAPKTRQKTKDKKIQNTKIANGEKR
jgi:hypothetical protein